MEPTNAPTVCRPTGLCHRSDRDSAVDPVRATARDGVVRPLGTKTQVAALSLLRGARAEGPIIGREDSDSAGGETRHLNRRVVDLLWHQAPVGETTAVVPLAE